MEIPNATALPALIDCNPLSLQRTNLSSPVSAMPWISSWGTVGTRVENHASPQVSMDFSGMFDERYQPWILDMNITRMPPLSEASGFG